MDDLWYLAAAYAAMIGLIGWFTWQVLNRLTEVRSRLDAVESSLNNDEQEQFGGGFKAHIYAARPCPEAMTSAYLAVRHPHIQWGACVRSVSENETISQSVMRQRRLFDVQSVG